ncbi:MAG: DegT/DnrJ/EryC1/StrS family aminotransferase [bacterium]
MKIPFGTISITKESKELINKILDSGRVSGGKYVREFEERFAKLIGVKESVAVSTGTDADALALAVLYDFGAKRGDEVILPALSFSATGNAVLQAGFKPVFVDIKRETLNIDVKKIEAVITSKTRAIMPVHLMGKPADMDSIKKIAKKHSFYIIEDAAEAHGAVYKGKNVGSLGDMAAYSLYVAHMISTVEGGIVTTDRSDFAEILRSLRSHGRACKCKSCVLNIKSGYCPKRFQYGDDIRFIFERIGYSSKMNELEAAIGLGALKNYKDILEKRRKNLLSLREKFEIFKPYLTTIKEKKYEKIGPHAFPIIIEEKAPFKRNQLVDYLEKNGIETRSLFSSMPTQCKGFSFLGYKLGDFPNAEYIGNNGLHIGVHQDLNEEHIDYFISKIEEFLSDCVK